jgi:hypothetical protein
LRVRSRSNEPAAIATDVTVETFYRRHLEPVKRFVARHVDDPDLAADPIRDLPRGVDLVTLPSPLACENLAAFSTWGAAPSEYGLDRRGRPARWHRLSLAAISGQHHVLLWRVPVSAYAVGFSLGGEGG